ncbi:hypothetical protein GGR50DRAFT_700239 [Xylaria sp. CBS 124048]|nr:hypothetical protein GGR50DRAFT_700239 [Xylaria sp. CBS 124048]
MDRVIALKSRRAKSSAGTGKKARAQGRHPARIEKTGRASGKKTRTWIHVAERRYACQLTLMIILYARSYGGLRPVEHFDSQRVIGFIDGNVPKDHIRIRFKDFLTHVWFSQDRDRLRSYIDALEGDLLDALTLLHDHRISFPVGEHTIEFSIHRHAHLGDLSSVRLFIPWNKQAGWASDELPSTWKADQREQVRSIFVIAKMFELIDLRRKPTILAIEGV